MEKPDFPLPAGKYVVTGERDENVMKDGEQNDEFPGGRETTTLLTVGAEGQWSLADGATLHDVTHLPCRSARYKMALETESISTF